MHRTDTKQATGFDLPAPYAGSFLFPPGLPTGPSPILVTIPAGSENTWQMPYHWHWSEIPHANKDDYEIPTDIDSGACVSVEALESSMAVSIVYPYRDRSLLFVGDGLYMKFPKGTMVTWKPASSTASEPLKASLLTTDHVLWRNICSAILDRDLYPRLGTTSHWLRFFFALLAAVRPTWHSWLLDRVLVIQITSIYVAHDLHVNCGYLPVTWLWTRLVPWPDRRPPTWAFRLQHKIMFAIAWCVMSSISLAARVFLGIRGEYEEYTPNPAAVYRDDKM